MAADAEHAVLVVMRAPAGAGAPDGLQVQVDEQQMEGLRIQERLETAVVPGVHSVAVPGAFHFFTAEPGRTYYFLVTPGDPVRIGMLDSRRAARRLAETRPRDFGD
jgi:hypothetical protein